MKRLATWLGTDIRLPLLAGALGLAAWPFLFTSSYDLRVFTIVGIYALLALGFQLIFGHAGALALTQGCYFGIGAYVTRILATRFGMSGELTLLLSAAIPVLLAMIVAAPVLRLESHYFALATLGIGQVMLLIAIAWQDVTGGSNGLAGIPPMRILGIEFGKGYGILLLVWGFVALGAWASRRITGGLYGAALCIARENPIAAQSIGVDTSALRYATFLLSALYAGVAGAMYAHTVRVVSVEALEFPIMVACLTIAVVGGRTHVAGAILGAVLVVNLPEWFRDLEKTYLIAYGLVLLAMIVIAPEGLIGSMQRLRSRWFGAPAAAERQAAPARTAEPQQGIASLSRAARHPPVAPGEPLLRIEGVTRRFGGLTALSSVNLDVRAGEIFGLIGPNGSGKTTLINIVSGAYRADAGRVVLAGSEISGLPSFRISRSGVARTFQNINLVDEMSVIDNVAVARFAAEHVALTDAFIPGRSETAWQRARDHAATLLQALDIESLSWQPAGGLAYGIKRKVEIARALALDPVLLLLDEPAAGLNESEQLDLAARLRRFAANGLSVLLIEHNMPFLMPLADRVACLDRGSVIALGLPEQIRNSAQVISAYLGAPSGSDPVQPALQDQAG
ncbi:MAG: ABC transporter permease subunit [Betaproteobacteria bacterium]